MSFFDPKPSLEFIGEGKTNGNRELVTIDSRKWKHMEMYFRERAFKREFGYDFILCLTRAAKYKSDDVGRGFFLPMKLSL